MRLDHIRTVIAFGAHPDDVEVGAGGLVAKLVDAGAAVTIVVGSIPNQFATRHAEATAAANELGARLVLPPGNAETRLDDVPMHKLVARLEAELGSVTPDLVITHAAGDAHEDHAMMHRAVLAALRRSRCDILAYSTRLPAGAAPRPATAIVDITAVIEKKLAAIARHASQFPPTFADARRTIARALGLSAGVEYAESYEVLRIAL
jgi:LmbE family N-acetylglucosaminyl deacetylase